MRGIIFPCSPPALPRLLPDDSPERFGRWISSILEYSCPLSADEYYVTQNIDPIKWDEEIMAEIDRRRPTNASNRGNTK